MFDLNPNSWYELMKKMVMVGESGTLLVDERIILSVMKGSLELPCPYKLRSHMITLDNERCREKVRSKSV